MAAVTSMWARSASSVCYVARLCLVGGSKRRPFLKQYSTAANGKPADAAAAAAASETSRSGEATQNAAPEPQKQEASGVEKALIEERNKLQEDLKELKDRYMRSLAETENVRQRMMKQVEDAKLYGIQGFCKDLLEVADILGTATASVPPEELTDANPHLRSLFDGLKMTETQLQKVFGKHGLFKIAPAEGDKFDPNLHEALFQVPATNKPGDTVAIVQQIGYRLHDRTLRPARVGVFKES